MSTCPWVPHYWEVIYILLSNLHKIGAKRAWLGFQATLLLHAAMPSLYFIIYEGGGARQTLRISRKMESLLHTDMEISALWGKWAKGLHVIWPRHPLLWQEFILYDCDLWHENTASVGVVMIHDGTYTWTLRSSDSSPRATWETRLTTLHSRKPQVPIPKQCLP